LLREVGVSTGGSPVLTLILAGFFGNGHRIEIVIAHPQSGLQYHFRTGFYDKLISLSTNEISD
jgi:hypothetical protein